jgi:hypothetical protein
MLFIISSASGKPCKESFKMDLTPIDRRNVSTLKEARLPKYSHWSKEFFSSGTNHREEDNMIARNLNKVTEEVIEVPNIDYILTLVRKYGKIIIYMEDYVEVKQSLKIYDDYIE